MQTKWKSGPPVKVSDVITDYRLSRSTILANRPAPEEIWWSALLDLNDTAINELEKKLHAQYPGQYITTNDYSPEERAQRFDQFIITIYAKRQVLNALNQVDNGFGVKTVLLGAIAENPTFNDDAASFLPEPVSFQVPQNTATIAVIDDGLAFAHNLFRSGQVTSRVESVYIMGSPATSDGPFYTLGRVIDRPEIDMLLENNTYSGFLDEDSFYNQAGVINHADFSFSGVAFRRSHGTHVMALAAGFEMDTGHVERPILGVQLPSRVTADVSGQSLYPSLLSAIRFIRRNANRMQLENSKDRRAPLVVNFSYGNYGGPHDGTSLIARLIDQELKSSKAQNVRAVLPAGNSNLERCHAKASFSDSANEKTVTLDLNVLPDDHTCSYVQMWMPYCPHKPQQNFVSIRVTPPNGPPSGPVYSRAGSRQILLNDDEQIIAELVYSFEKKPTNRGLITLLLNPTTSHEHCTDLVTPGRWKIEIQKNELEHDQNVEIWIRRDETLPGYPPYGRQARFDNADYVRFDEFGAPLATDPPKSHSPVKRAGTLSGFASATEPVLVAGFAQSDGLLADYSSAGPITLREPHAKNNRYGPDVATRSDDSPVLSGVLSAGSHSGSMVRMNGTSVAAPLVARYIANALAKRKPADRKWIQKQAKKSEQNFPNPKPNVTRTGGGRLALPYPFQALGPTE